MAYRKGIRASFAPRDAPPGPGVSQRGATCRSARRRHPARAVVADAEVHKASEVHRSGPVRHEEAVALDASVPHLAGVGTHEPGDGALDHRAVGAVDLVE